MFEYMYTYPHIYICVYIHTDIHLFIQTHSSFACAVYTHTFYVQVMREKYPIVTHTHACTRTHTRIHTNKHDSCAYICMDIHKLTWHHVYMYAYMCTCADEFIHECITYICIKFIFSLMNMHIYIFTTPRIIDVQVVREKFHSTHCICMYKYILTFPHEHIHVHIFTAFCMSWAGCAREIPKHTHYTETFRRLWITEGYYIYLGIIYIWVLYISVCVCFYDSRYRICRILGAHTRHRK